VSDLESPATTPLHNAGLKLLRELEEVETFRDGAPAKPKHFAEHAALIQDALDTLSAIEGDLEDRLAIRKAQIELAIENDDLPDGFKAGGRTFYDSAQLWAGPAHGDNGKPDHAALSEVLEDLGLVEYLPSTVNSQSFSAYVREHLDPDRTKPLQERLLNDTPKPLDPRLWAAISATEKRSIKLPKS
jgi:hypothetical protein